MPGCWSAGTSTSAAFACPSPWQRLPVLPRTPGAVVVGARGGACGPVPAGCPLLGDALGAPAPFFPFCPQTGSVSALRRAPSVSMSLCSSFPASSSHNGDHGGWKDDSSRLISVAAAKQRLLAQLASLFRCSGPFLELLAAQGVGASTLTGRVCSRSTAVTPLMPWGGGPSPPPSPSIKQQQGEQEAEPPPHTDISSPAQGS